MGWLETIKAVHTLVWAVFASCIFAIPVFAWRGQTGVARGSNADPGALRLVDVTGYFLGKAPIHLSKPGSFRGHHFAS